jgi:hypothetical protein
MRKPGSDSRPLRPLSHYWPGFLTGRLSCAGETWKLGLVGAGPVGAHAAAPVECALARRNGWRRIGPQLVATVRILISRRQPIDPPGHRFFDPALDPFRFAPVLETGGKLPRDARPLFDLAQRQTARIAGDAATAGPGRHVTASKGLNWQEDSLHCAAVRLRRSGFETLSGIFHLRERPALCRRHGPDVRPRLAEVDRQPAIRPSGSAVSRGSIGTPLPPRRASPAATPPAPSCWAPALQISTRPCPGAGVSSSPAGSSSAGRRSPPIRPPSACRPATWAAAGLASPARVASSRQVRLALKLYFRPVVKPRAAA